jgi:hypothetical protein
MGPDPSLAGEDSASVPALDSPHASMKELAKKLRDDKDALAKAGEAQECEKLAGEKAELEDKKILASNRAKLGPLDV